MTDLRTALTDLAEQARPRDLAGTAWRTARLRRRRRVATGAAGAVVLVVGLAAGLGLLTGGSAPPPVAGGTPSRVPSRTTPSAASTSKAWSTPSAAEGGISFASPSGNITCLLGSSEVICDVARYHWSVPPASCGQAALAGLLLPATGRAGYDCRTDVLVPNPEQVLGYGQTISTKRFACTSAVTGVTCRDRKSGHGFFVSRQAYRLH